MSDGRASATSWAVDKNARLKPLAVSCDFVFGLHLFSGFRAGGVVIASKRRMLMRAIIIQRVKWTRGELNPCPELATDDFKHAYLWGIPALVSLPRLPPPAFGTDAGNRILPRVEVTGDRGLPGPFVA